MSQGVKVHWHLVFLAAFGILVMLVLADVLFVAYYSYLLDPVHDEAYYRQFAQNTGAPFVFFFGPLPIFLIVRWVGHKVKDRAMVHAVVIAVIILILDVTVAFLSGQPAVLLQPGHFLAHLAKLAAVLLGGWFAQRETAKAKETQSTFA